MPGERLFIAAMVCFGIAAVLRVLQAVLYLVR